MNVFKQLSKRTPSRDVECNVAGFLAAPKVCRSKIVKRTFSYADVRTRPPLVVLLSSIALHATLLWHVSRRCYVKILEARSLLKIFFAVTCAASISKISFLCPSPRLRVAGKRLDPNGGVV